MSLDLVTCDLAYNRSGVPHVDTKKLLTKCHHTHARASRKPNVEAAVKELFVAVEERVVEGYAALIGVKSFIGLSCLQLFMILAEDVSHVCLDVLRQTHL